MPPMLPLQPPRRGLKASVGVGDLTRCGGGGVGAADMLSFWLYCVSDGIPVSLAGGKGAASAVGVLHVDEDRCAFIDTEGVYSKDGTVDPTVATLQHAYDAWHSAGRPSVSAYQMDIWPGTISHVQQGDRLANVRWRVGEVNRLGDWVYRIKRLRGQPR